MPDKSMTPTPELCPATHIVYWKGGGENRQCELPANHVGQHSAYDSRGRVGKWDDATPPAAIKESLTVQPEGPGIGFGEIAIGDIEAGIRSYSNRKERERAMDIFNALKNQYPLLLLEITRLRAAESVLHDMAAYKTRLEAEVARLRGALEPLFRAGWDASQLNIESGYMCKGKADDYPTALLKALSSIPSAPQAPASPSGSGHAPGAGKVIDRDDPNNCQRCNGTGKSPMHHDYTCSDCFGIGRVPWKSKCPECGLPGHSVVANPGMYTIWACENANHPQWKTPNTDGGRHA